MPNAAILLECDLTGGADWLDTADHYWLDTSDHYWFDGTVLRASQEGYADMNYWGAYILAVDPPQWQIATPYGGYCKLGWGGFRLAQEFFDSTPMWPPPTNMFVKFYYTPGNESDKEALFSGTAHLTGWDRDGVDYELFGEEYDADLLEEGTDYDGDTVAFPLAVGEGYCRTPTRIADVGGYFTYMLPFISTSLEPIVLDDGVDVTANAVNNGNGTFSLTVAPVGEVTVVGIDTPYHTLISFFRWACEPDRLNLKFDSSLAVLCLIKRWVPNQQTLLQFLSNLAAWNRHLFYIKDGTLYLVWMDSDNGTATYTQNDIGPVTYSMNAPLSSIHAKWEQRIPVEETIGKYVKTYDREGSVASAYPYGDKMEVAQYSTDLNDSTAVRTVLTNILSDIHKDNATIPIPMAAGLPVPGKSITWTEPAESAGGAHVRGVTGTIRARTIVYDFANYVYKITGEGTISAIDPDAILTGCEVLALP
jgi:hypothetical protein